ncbi:GAF domain-containing sensor histidine kinase, partial [bacterium]
EDLFLEMGELLNSTLDEVSILRTFCNKILSLFDAERVSILAVDPQEKHLILTAWAGRYPDDIEGVKVPLGDGVAGWVAATGDSLLVPDVEQDPRFSQSLPGRYRTSSFISVPLKSRARLLGVLNVTDATHNEGFTEQNLRTLEPLALQVGMGMENLRLRDMIESGLSTSTSLIFGLQELQPGSTDIETDLMPSLVRGLKTALGLHSHLVLIGEMGTNRACVGRPNMDGPSEGAVMDFRSGFGLYQSIAALPLQPPIPDNKRLTELGFPWDLVLEGELQLLRSLLPPKHNMFGMALSAVPERDPETMDLLRNSQNILIEFGGLVMVGIFDRSQIQKLDHLKTELISTVSHELRTPLTSIQGFSELVLRGKEVADPQRRYLNIIQNESKRLNRLINNFLDLARLESGELSLVKEPTDPVQIVESAVKLLKPQAEVTKASVRLHCEENLPFLIADRDRLEQVLVNLVGNAIKHGGEGVQIEINVGEKDGHTSFAISDDGPGIRWEEKDLIFNRFYRGILDREDEEDDENKGTGLGLALTREIIEQHGGNINMESLPNEKTSFHFTLPTQGLVSPQRGITAWNPGDENFSIELANRLAEGKTVGVLTIHVNPKPSDLMVEMEYSVEGLEEVEDLISATLWSTEMGDDFIQSRPQGEFLILTYSSLVDEYAANLLKAFADRFGGHYDLAIGAAVPEGDEEPEAERLIALSQQACQYVEKTQKTGYLKNRRV